ncbi:hypothetical protein FHS95_002506 [Sphingomonas naasensis]|uniref:Uncharacterized protein n=1 Tax=Sphingomonas naasensis TaxID=1344951 RepID=A0A4S1WPN4_9SPHN|nr:hypothetical protein [Sphingomonas naasensis]NIJ20814.1 hypothetical protein [Sphingomonas naasensis]TGX43216.1 hypothetical protein E5A74_08575 [Sphingomonas naasensis]
MRRIASNASFILLALASSQVLVRGRDVSAQAGPSIQAEIVTVPAEFVPASDNPMDAYTAFFGQLRKRAAREVADGKSIPLAATLPWGSRSEKLLVGAITPGQAVFYIVPAGPYRSGTPVLALLPRNVETCRFEIVWSDRPFDGDPRSMDWARSSFPGPDCAPSTKAAQARIAAWKADSSQSTFSVVGRATAQKLTATLVKEVPSIEARPAGSFARPFDSYGAMSTIAGPSDAVIKTVPLPDSAGMSTFALSRRGRTWVSFKDRDHHFQQCIVEGLTWNELATPGDRGRVAQAARLCSEMEAAAKLR